MATAAHSTKVRTYGTSTPFTGQAMTLVSGKTYEVAAAGMRLLDPTANAGVDVFDGGTPVATTNYTVDWLFGRITFAPSYTPSGAVTLSGRYLPTVPLLEVSDYSFTVTADVLETTAFESPHRTRQHGLRDVSGSFKTYLTDRDAATSEGGTSVAGLSGLSWLFEVEYPSGMRFRAWVTAESIESGGSADGLIETTVNFTGAPTANTAEDFEAPRFGWG